MQGRSIFSILCAVVASTAILGSVARAQETGVSDTSRTTLAVHGGYSLLSHDAAFAVDGSGNLVSSTGCGSFTSGRGNGWIARVSLGLPLTEDLRFVLAPAFEHHAGTLRYSCVDPAQTRLPDGTLVPALTEFVADIGYDELSVGTSLEYRPRIIPIRLTVGPSVSFAFDSRYDVREEIVSPSSAEFVSGGQRRQFGRGSFSDVESPAFALEGGLSYTAPIGRNLALTPELRYRYRFTDEVSWAHLKTHALFGMLGIEYTFRSAPPPPASVVARTPEQPIPPTAPEPEPEPTPPLNVSVTATALDRRNISSDTATIDIRRVIRTEFHPLLPYLFFDAGSDRIPERYHLIDSTATRHFAERDMKGRERLPVYHDLLNIVGLRMRAMPGATLTLTGTEPDASKTQGTTGTLAQRRAESVRTYLSTVWGIAASRISIVTRHDPTSPTNSSSEEGAAENRRVEIAASIPAIIDPVILDDTVTVADWSRVVVTPEIHGGTGLESWDLTARLGDREVATAHGTSAPPTTIPVTLDSIVERQQSPERNPGSLMIRLAARDSAGTRETSTTSLPLRRTTTETLSRENGYYSLILFDFGSANLRPEHLRIIDFINQRTVPGTQLSVTGYTDRLGEEGTNLQLSTRRAESVAAHLQGTVVRTTGLGASVQLHDNALPEGRFYSRSVTIRTTN